MGHTDSTALSSIYKSAIGLPSATLSNSIPTDLQNSTAQSTAGPVLLVCSISFAPLCFAAFSWSISHGLISQPSPQSVPSKSTAMVFASLHFLSSLLLGDLIASLFSSLYSSGLIITLPFFSSVQYIPGSFSCFFSTNFIPSKKLTNAIAKYDPICAIIPIMFLVASIISFFPLLLLRTPKATAALLFPILLLLSSRLRHSSSFTSPMS